MKKNNRIYLILVAGIITAYLVFGFYSVVTAHRAKNLYDFALSAKTVNVHIGEFASSDETKKIKTEDLKKAIRQRLIDRKTTDFNIVNKGREADLSIIGKITKFDYRDNDPVDIYFPPIGLVMDLATQKNYVRLEYEITVLDNKKNKVVWKKQLKATVTEFEMGKEKSVPLIIDRAAYVFIKECFGRPKPRQRI